MSVYKELMNEMNRRPGRKQKGTSRPFGSRGPRARKLSPEDQAAFDKVFPPPKKKEKPVEEEAQWRPTVSQFGKKLTKGNPKGKEGDIARQRSTLAKKGTVETGKFTTPPGKPIRMKKHKPGKEYMKSHPDISYTRDDKGTMTVAHTEHEGPSLREKIAYLFEVVSRKKKAARKAAIRALPKDKRPKPSAPLDPKSGTTVVRPGKEEVAHRAMRRPFQKELKPGRKHFRGTPKGENPDSGVKEDATQGYPEKGIKGGTPAAAGVARSRKKSDLKDKLVKMWREKEKKEGK